MKNGLKLCLLAAAVFLSGCGWFGGPTSVAKDYVYSLRDAKYDDAFKLLSDEYVKSQGEATIRTNMKGFHELLEAQKARGGISLENPKETIEGNNAKVYFRLKGGGENNTVRMGFIMIKDHGNWKINQFD